MSVSVQCIGTKIKTTSIIESLKNHGARARLLEHPVCSTYVNTKTEQIHSEYKTSRTLKMSLKTVEQ